MGGGGADFIFMGTGIGLREAKGEVCTELGDGRRLRESKGTSLNSHQVSLRKAPVFRHLIIVTVHVLETDLPESYISSFWMDLHP